MSTATDKFVALNKDQLETGFAALEIAVKGWEQWIDLNIEATKALTRETTEQARALIKAEDVPAAWNGWSTGFVQRNWERSHGYSRNFYEILVRTNLSVGEVLEQKLLDINQEWMEMIEMAAMSAPVGHSDATVSAVKSAMFNATTVIEGISKAARQAAEYADTTVKAAASATAEAVSESAGKKVQ